MLLKINGKQETINTKLSLSELILKKGLCSEKIIVERNLKIIEKEKWHSILLKENDNIEIVSFVAGG